jgi:hypothetical protein
MDRGTKAKKDYKSPGTKEEKEILHQIIQKRR